MLSLFLLTSYAANTYCQLETTKLPSTGIDPSVPFAYVAEDGRLFTVPSNYQPKLLNNFHNMPTVTGNFSNMNTNNENESKLEKFKQTIKKLKAIISLEPIINGTSSSILLIYNSARNGDQVARKRLEKAAKKGNNFAQFYLGFMYDTGYGLAQSYPLAKCNYKLAAKQGHTDAQNNLGVMYATGCGMNRQNDKKAVHYFLRAANRGHIHAQYNLGIMYATGRGVEQDNKKAENFFCEVAKQGDVDAQYNFAYMRQKGALQKYSCAHTSKKKARFSNILLDKQGESSTGISSNGIQQNNQKRYEKTKKNHVKKIISATLKTPFYTSSASDQGQYVLEDLKFRDQEKCIGPKLLPGWKFLDTGGTGSGFYDAIHHQMLLNNYDSFKINAKHTSSVDSKGFSIDTELKEFLENFHFIVAIVDTRNPAAGFMCHYKDEDAQKIMCARDIPEQHKHKPIIKIATTGNQYLSVVNTPWDSVVVSARAATPVER